MMSQQREKMLAAAFAAGTVKMLPWWLIAVICTLAAVGWLVIVIIGVLE